MKMFNEKLQNEFLCYKKVDGECANHLFLLITREVNFEPLPIWKQLYSTLTFYETFGRT